MFKQIVFLFIFVYVNGVPFSETKVICGIDSIQIIAANFDYLNGLKIILGDHDQTSGDDGYISDCVADGNRSIVIGNESLKRWNFGCGMKLTNDATEASTNGDMINYQWNGVLKYVRKESRPVGHIIRSGLKT